MKTNQARHILQILALVTAICSGARADQLGPATICSGAARLDNGSIVTIGQPFVGTTGATDGGVSLSIGIIPILSPATTTASNAPVILQPSLAMQNGTFTFTLRTDVGRNYVVEASSDLLHWAPVETTAGNGKDWTFQDTDALRIARRFYRVRVW